MFLEFHSVGFDYDEKVYANTRRFALSKDNPNYRIGQDGKYKGVGSAHMRLRVRNNVWPMAQAMQGTANTFAHFCCFLFVFCYFWFLLLLLLLL
jgi:meiotically up-regulated gene 157 (Mug157) protein